MAEIRLDIIEDRMKFSLTGDISSLYQKRKVRLYLEDFLHAELLENEILIPFEGDTKEDLLKAIQEMLSDNGVSEARSELVEKAFEDYLREEVNFREFSNEARAIRNKNFSIKQKDELQEFGASLSTNLPARKLYDLQLLAAFHLTFAHNACNFSVPGSGKTSIVYAAYSYLKHLEPTDPKYISKLLIVGPLSSFGPWEDEYSECFGEKPNSKRLAGGIDKDERVHHFYGSNPSEISLLSYNSIPSIREDLIFFLRKHPTMVVLDEAHKIKNTEGGAWANAALDIAQYCRSRIVLTGTPAPNGYEDIYNLFKFIWPTKDIIRYYPYQLREMSENPKDFRIPNLIQDISPFFIRIKKSDLKLPKPIEHKPLVVEMGDIQRDIYLYIEKNYMDYFSEQSASAVSMKSSLTKARLVRLMQASTNPDMLRKPLDEFLLEEGYANELFIDDSEIFNKIMGYNTLETPPKFIAALDLIKQIIDNGEKVIVWTIFIQNLIDLQAFLDEQEISSKILYGATPIEQDDSLENIETRESIIREFHDENSSFKVLIANPFAISESISLHKACHNAIYLEKSFNAGNFIQSKDRIHRYGLGPDDIINYYYILSNNNIDYTIHQRLLEKEERMLKIIESEEIPLFNILDDSNGDDADLRALIQNYANKNF